MPTTSREPIILKVPDYEPSERQTAFHTSQAYETLYGGAAGGGKTAALVAEAITVCLEYPGITPYIFRRTIPELKATILPEVFRQCASYIDHGHLKWHGTDREFRFRNGSVLKLAYCDAPTDIYRYQGAEIPQLFIDEVTHWPFDWYEYLKTRVRTANPSWPTKIKLATNPGNVGHGWVKNLFIDSMPPEQMYTDPETHLTRIFIPAKVSDHPLEDFRADYTRKLSAIRDDHLRRALLEGDWDQFSGQVFTEWRRQKHVVAPFDIPEHWTQWFSFDWGYNTFSAGLWFAKDPQTNRIYVTRELYKSKTPASVLAEDIKLYAGAMRTHLADPALWKGSANAETGETVAQIMSKNGVNLLPANNDRLGGKNAVHEALSIAPDGKPWLQVFANCSNLIRTLPSLPYDEHKIEDVDTDAEDHLYDALRYGLMNQRNPKPDKAKRRRKYDPVTGRLLG